MSNITHAYLGGLVHKRGDDGFLYVNGLVSDDTLDLDQQRCDPNWLSTAVPGWFKSAGNVRLMHQPNAVGKAKELSQKGTGWNAMIKVTNPQVATDIEEGVLTGLSVGIKNARVDKSLTAPNGLIVGGDIIEVSLVDRPANPSCTIEMAKMDGGDWQFQGIDIDHSNNTELVVSSPITPEGLEPGEGWIPAPDAPLGKPESDEDIEDASDAQENVQDAETVLALDDQKSATVDTIRAEFETFLADIEKRQFSDKEREAAAKTGAAMPGGGFPIKSVEDLKNAIQAIGRAKDRTATIAHIKSRAKSLGRSDLIPDNWKTAQGLVQVLFADVQKGATADEWMHDPTQCKTVSDGLIDFAIAELNEMKSGENEIGDIYMLLSAFDTFTSWVNHEAQEGETTPPFNTGDDDMANAFVNLGVSADLFKSASAEDATDESKTELTAEIRKVLGVDEEIATYKALLTTMQETVDTVKAELAEVQEMAAPGGPVLRQTSDQRRQSAAHDAITSKVSEFRSRAELATDLTAKKAFRDQADALEATLTHL